MCHDVMSPHEVHDTAPRLAILRATMQHLRIGNFQASTTGAIPRFHSPDRAHMRCLNFQQSRMRRFVETILVGYWYRHVEMVDRVCKDLMLRLLVAEPSICSWPVYHYVTVESAGWRWLNKKNIVTSTNVREDYLFLSYLIDQKSLLWFTIKVLYNFFEN